MHAVVVDVSARDGRARTGVASTARGTYRTPIFMPVGTRGAVKFLDAADYADLGAEIVLGNTYHLMLRPGPAVVEQLGGLGADAVNGGVLAAIFDLVIGSTPALIDPTRRTATMQLSMSFMKPVRGKRFHAEAWVDSAGGSTLFSSAVIKDEHGGICARCQGVVKMSKGPWASGNSPAMN